MIRISIPGASLFIARKILIPALLIAALLAAACGGDGEPGPGATVRDYYRALLAGDGARACSLLTDGLERDIARSAGARAAGGSCPDVLGLAIGLNPDREGVTRPRVGLILLRGWTECPSAISAADAESRLRLRLICLGHPPALLF